MNVVYGYGGMRSDGEMLVFNPTIPEHWKSYSFQITYRGSLIRVEVWQQKAQITLLDGSPVSAVIRGEVREINSAGLTL
jgi:maltose phosphorylase